VQRDPTDAEGKRLFDVEELVWFCRNAYNLGMKHASTWDLRQTIQILTSCVQIIGKFPSDLGSEASGDLSLKAMFCNFMISSGLTAIARTEDDQEQQRGCYRAARKSIAAFDMELQSRLRDLEGNLAQDLLEKLSVLFAFDFEAAVCVQQWGQLGEIVRKAVVCRSATAYQVMGDCLLRSGAPDQGEFCISSSQGSAPKSLTLELFTVMRTIVNELWELEGFGAKKLAKYNRCLFQATLARNNELAFHLIKETCDMAREANDVSAAPGLSHLSAS